MDVKPFCIFDEMEIPGESVIFDPSVRALCKAKYPGRNKGDKIGCPNYGKNPLCPPQAPYRPDFCKKGIFHLAWVEFNIDEYADEMKRIDTFSTWSDGQLKNRRLWQNSLKSKLGEYIKDRKWVIEDALGCGSGLIINGTRKQAMESAGIDVFQTAANVNLVLEREYPLHLIHLVALLKLKPSEKSLEDFVNEAKKKQAADELKRWDNMDLLQREIELGKKLLW